jgi:hypothetical protein
MKPAVLLLLLTLAACTGASDPPTCSGEPFALNPTRITPAATMAAAPETAPAGRTIE